MKTLFKISIVAALLLAPIVQFAAVQEKEGPPGVEKFTAGDQAFLFAAEQPVVQLFTVADNAIKAEPVVQLNPVSAAVWRDVSGTGEPLTQPGPKPDASPWWLTLLLLGPCVGVVLSSQIEALPNNSRVQGFTHLITLTHADLTETTANTAQAFTVAIPAKSLVQDVIAILDIPFEDTTDAAFNSTAVTIGDTGSATRFMSSTELNVNGTEILTKKMSGSATAYPAADTFTISVAAMSAKNLAALNKGRLKIYANIIRNGDIG